MDDAIPEPHKYNVNTTIDSPYKVVSVAPYYYSSTTSEILPLSKIPKIFHNNLVFDFDRVRIKNEQEYLLFHIQYGPHFTFNRFSEAVCIAPITGLKIVDDVHCDTLTTALYLIAASEQPFPLKEKFTPEIIERMIVLSNMPQTQSWQNYQALLTFLLNHLSENPEYEFVNLKGNYLNSMLEFSHEIKQLMLTKRRITLLDYEDILSNIDNSIVNVGYRIFSSLVNLSKQHASSLPFVVKHPTYLEDFYSGLSPFTLIEPESLRLVNVTYSDGIIHYSQWPWFDKVEYSFDKSDPIFTNGSTLPVPDGAIHAYIRPYGKRGKFLRTTVQVGQYNQQLIDSELVTK